MGLQLCLFTASFKSAFAYTLFTDHKGKFLAPIISIHYFSPNKPFQSDPWSSDRQDLYVSVRAKSMFWWSLEF